MLPVDGRQLENVKGELLKLKKKEAADCNYGTTPDRRVEETEEPSNSRLSDMAQRGKERRAEEQRNSRLAVMGQRSQQRRAEETEEERSRRLSTMAQRGQKRRAEDTEEQRNSRLLLSISFLESLCVWIH
ncbi:hypothetical protein AVEN_70981-1 [Araneus ventricosus]|uniref:STPR domain-containing protein n=1 Tax=Araneus ventricosus TaxID=182803 RepID=A0A4Y2KPU5_ARAVE|nr:hypothetical protein AVEN_70981-1 [Araneus ventricosus]